jgi:hypothetical protein
MVECAWRLRAGFSTLRSKWYRRASARLLFHLAVQTASATEGEASGGKARPQAVRRIPPSPCADRQASQPFTPPDVSPETIHFCASRNTTVIGSPDSTAAAAKSPHR